MSIIGLLLLKWIMLEGKDSEGTSQPFFFHLYLRACVVILWSLHKHALYHITAHMLMHIHGRICLLLLERQTTGHTSKSPAGSIRLVVMQHYTRQLLLHCTFVVALERLFIKKCIECSAEAWLNTQSHQFVAVLLSRSSCWPSCLSLLKSLPGDVYTCVQYGLFLLHWLATKHLRSMGKGLMTRNVTGFH